MRKVNILPQPTDSTCGPTSLHAVYDYFGDKVSLKTVVNEVKVLKEGGTLAVMLGCHALRRGYDTVIYTYNLRIFDPTWDLSNSKTLIQNLIKQAQVKKGKKFNKATKAYIKFLLLGGKLVSEDLTIDLLKRLFNKKLPVLTGLSATYLYNFKRETVNYKNESIYDDIKGIPVGHFVVLNGFNRKGDIIVADPYHGNPLFGSSYYSVKPQRLINAIMLGLITYDANLLVISPKKK